MGLVWFALLVGVEFAAIVAFLFWEPASEPQPRQRRGERDWRQPRIDGMVHYLGLAGRSVILETQRGVQVQITGDTITLDEALEYLAEIETL